MELVIPAPKDAQTALRFCRCAEKAANMKAEGYTLKVNPYIEDCLMVFKPFSSSGFCPGAYAICLQQKRCFCPDFERNGSFCKHLIFASNELDAENAQMWEAICAEVEAGTRYADVVSRL